MNPTHEPGDPHGPAATHSPAPHASADPAASSAHPGDAAHHAHPGHFAKRFDDPVVWSAVFDDPARDAWQRPDDVVAALVTRDDLAVADVGAGTGYFAVRFARALPRGRVFGVDIEPGMVEHLNERARRDGLPNLEAHLAPPGDPSLGALGRPLDLVFVCDTYHHIPNRTAYFANVRSHMAPGGRLAIVDFRLDSKRGPPAEHKLAPEVVTAELTAAGFKPAGTLDFLPDQYLLLFE